MIRHTTLEREILELFCNSSEHIENINFELYRVKTVIQITVIELWCRLSKFVFDSIYQVISAISLSLKQNEL